MSNEQKDYDEVIGNEKEWRRHILKKLDRMEDRRRDDNQIIFKKYDRMNHNFNVFKIKSFGFITLLIGGVEAFSRYFNKH